jgi:hypothetical protein
MDNFMIYARIRQLATTLMLGVVVKKTTVAYGLDARKKRTFN